MTFLDICVSSKSYNSTMLGYIYYLLSVSTSGHPWHFTKRPIIPYKNTFLEPLVLCLDQWIRRWHLIIIYIRIYGIILNSQHVGSCVILLLFFLLFFFFGRIFKMIYVKTNCSTWFSFNWYKNANIGNPEYTKTYAKAEIRDLCLICFTKSSVHKL